eukprot:TRINITY_DN9495_c0_g1_i1.p2 TRINITY_DN9495_c0_g1~~TRINITY_DN9495_c0_g1_i1.p2  ORF type:complete len:144 (+),score=29.57 TRINITY_DN9495_c0_g1_i1:25-432(+)
MYPYGGGYPQQPMGYGGYPGTTTTTTYVSIPQSYVYNPSMYYYEVPYDPYMPFIPPMGVPPHIAQRMMNASAIFRRFDMNRSGMMEYNEWMMAMSALGYMMNPMDAPRLFSMIDRDRSGRISEREFVEYWAQYGW